MNLFKKLLAIGTLLLLPTIALAQGGGQFGGPASQPGLAANTPGIPAYNGPYFSAANYGLNASNIGHVVYDGVCTNGLSTLTSATANFQTNAVVGNVVWAVQNGGLGNAAASIPYGTITQINSNTQITVSTTGTSGCTTGQAVIWGTDVTAQINAMHTAAIAPLNCGQEHLPAGIWIISAAVMNAAPSSVCTGQLKNNFMGISGEGWQVTTLAPTPTFDFTTCNGSGRFACIGYPGMFLRDFQVHGFGVGVTTVPNTTATIFDIVTPGSAINISCQYFATQDPNVTGFTIDTGLSYIWNVQSANCGAIGPTWTSSTGAGPITGLYIAPGNGASPTINSASPGYDFSGGNWFGASGVNECAAVVAGFAKASGNFMSPGAELCVTGGHFVISGGSYTHNQGIAGRAAIKITSSGFVQLSGATVSDAGAGEFAVSEDGTSTVVSDGTNNFTGLINIAAGGKWIGPDSMNGSCSGTATSSISTGIGLYGLGQTAALTCTSTTVNLGVPARKAGTLVALNVSATHAGVSASSGVVTVLKNGGATALTCTIGTGTSCIDNTHSVSVVAGDVVSIQFTTQATEVLAGVAGQVILE